MKFLLLASLIFILSASVMSRAYDSKPEPDVKGGYKECTVFKYQYFHSKLAIESKKQYKTYKYDDNARIIETDFYYYIENTIERKEIYEYDGYGRIIKCYTSFKNKGNNTIDLIKYDDYDNVIEVIKYDENYKPQFKYEYIYSK